MFADLGKTSGCNSFEVNFWFLYTSYKIVNSVDFNDFLSEFFVVFGYEGDGPGGSGFYCWVEVFETED